MAHAQKPDFVFRRNERVHLNRRGRQFSRLLAADVCAISGSNAGYNMFRGSMKGTGSGYPLHSPVSPSLPLPCVTVCNHISTGLYNSHQEWTDIPKHARSVAEGCNPTSRLTLSGLVTHSGEILTTAKSHKQKPDRQFPTTYKQNVWQQTTQQYRPVDSKALLTISRNNQNRTSVPNYTLNK